MPFNPLTEHVPPNDPELTRRLHDAFVQRSPALDALLASLHGDQVPLAPAQAQRRRPLTETLLPAAESDVRHDFVLKIVVSYCNGATQQQIATMLGMHVQTIRAMLREAGVKIGERNARFSEDELQVIRRLHADGVSARELGRRYSVAHTTILRRLR